jgi:hypothetical protein
MAIASGSNTGRNGGARTRQAAVVASISILAITNIIQLGRKRVTRIHDLQSGGAHAESLRIIY